MPLGLMTVYEQPSRKNGGVNDDGGKVVLKYIDKSTNNNALYIGTYWKTLKQHTTGLQLRAVTTVTCSMLSINLLMERNQPSYHPWTITLYLMLS